MTRSVKELYYATPAIRKALKTFIARNGDDYLARRSRLASMMLYCANTRLHVTIINSFTDCDRSSGRMTYKIPANVVSFIHLQNQIDKWSDGTYTLYIWNPLTLTSEAINDI